MPVKKIRSARRLLIAVGGRKTSACAAMFVLSVVETYAQVNPCFDKGSDRILFPVTAKIALVIAGRIGGRAGSPSPVGEKSVARKCTSSPPTFRRRDWASRPCRQFCRRLPTRSSQLPEKESGRCLCRSTDLPGRRFQQQRGQTWQHRLRSYVRQPQSAGAALSGFSLPAWRC